MSTLSEDDFIRLQVRSYFINYTLNFEYYIKCNLHFSKI